MTTLLQEWAVPLLQACRCLLLVSSSSPSLRCPCWHSRFESSLVNRVPSSSRRRHASSFPSRRRRNHVSRSDWRPSVDAERYGTPGHVERFAATSYWCITTGSRRRGFARQRRRNGSKIDQRVEPGTGKDARSHLSGMSRKRAEKRERLKEEKRGFGRGLFARSDGLPMSREEQTLSCNTLDIPLQTEVPVTIHVLQEIGSSLSLNFRHVIGSFALARTAAVICRRRAGR